MEVSNLSFLNCDVFIKFNHHEYVETDYLKKKIFLCSKKQKLWNCRYQVFSRPFQTFSRPSLFFVSSLGIRASVRLRQMGSISTLTFPELCQVFASFCHLHPQG